MNIASTQYSLKDKSFEIYVSGCKEHPCKNCHNPELWDENLGEELNKKTVTTLVNKINNYSNMINKVSIFGGELLEKPLNDVIWFLRELRKTKKEVWLYTRYDLSDVPNEVVCFCDYIKTGQYVEELLVDDYYQYGVKLPTKNQKVYEIKEETQMAKEKQSQEVEVQEQQEQEQPIRGKTRYFYEVGEKVWYKIGRVPVIVQEINLDEKSVVIKSKANEIKKVNLWDIGRYREPLKIKVKYFDKDVKRLQKIKVGDWIDLSAAEDVEIKQFEHKLIPLGVAMELPRGYEANVVPRSSTFKNFGILQTNSYAVIDQSYKGNNDKWFMSVVALKDTKIEKGSRVCQFRINRVMPKIEFVEVEELDNQDRGGIGSTGK